MGKLNRLSATSAARRLATREITAQALLQDCLERIAERDPAVHAWTYVAGEAAMQRARALDAGAHSGLLHGLPIGVKDTFDTADMPTSYGSPIYSGHRPAWDAASVAVARAAGAVVVGKTVTTEFATYHPGPTRNPHNLEHTPGGSSSGSAAAVADWMVPLGFASQTAGSIVRPAAFCGVVGYKPTFGTVNRVGVKMISDTLDTVGVLARTVPDAALFVAALGERHDLLIDAQPIDAPRIGVCRTHEWTRAQPETPVMFDDVERRLRAAGATLHDVALPAEFGRMVAAQTTIMAHEVATCLAYERLMHRSQLSPEITTIIDAGVAVTPTQYDEARAVGHACRAMLAQVFTGCDVLIAPSAIGEAPAGVTATGDSLFNRMWTLLHTPCVHVPISRGPLGLPLGITVVGRLGGDRSMLSAATWIHEHLVGTEHADG